MNGHTPGDWIARPDPHGSPTDFCIGLDDDCSPVDYVAVCRARDAHLIAAAPDHAMIASSLCSGAARWEPFASGSGGEFCINGFRHATNLDQFGVPVMTDGMRAAIAAATREQP
ncbi:hypothetical protein [Rhodanobacter caeni]|uniref:Uncharacterized protein n=1 Tax=Rhodanobacter caeni TaxID=657654 RepID=A0ABN0USQ3_9GAMM